MNTRFPAMNERVQGMERLAAHWRRVADEAGHETLAGRRALELARKYQVEAWATKIELRRAEANKRD